MIELGKNMVGTYKRLARVTSDGSGKVSWKRWFDLSHFFKNSHIIDI